MVTRKPVRRKGPAFVATGDAAELRHNEPDAGRVRNLLPSSQERDLLAMAQAGSQAATRLYVEEVLLQRCGAVPAERWKALEAQAVPALLRLLADGTARVELRQRAIVELAELRAPSALAAVSTVLLDPAEDKITRAHAARAIGVIGDAAGIPALGRATTQADPVVRRQVALALDRFDTPQALRGLLRLVADADGEVARVAQTAVERQSKQLTTALKSVLKPRQAPPTRQGRGKTAPRPESKVTGRR